MGTDLKDTLKQLKGCHIMYIAEVCSGTQFHDRVCLGMKTLGSNETIETSSSNQIRKEGWQIEDLKEDEEYTVRVKTVLDGKTICIISQKLELAEDGVLDKIENKCLTKKQESIYSNKEVIEAVGIASDQTENEFYDEQRESMNSDGQTLEAEDVV